LQMPPTRPDSGNTSPSGIRRRLGWIVGTKAWKCGDRGRIARLLLSAPSCFMAATAEEAHQAEEVSKVVPSAVIVNLIDVEIVHEEGDHKDEWSDEALPEAEPESGNGMLVAGSAF